MLHWFFYPRHLLVIGVALLASISAETKAGATEDVAKAVQSASDTELRDELQHRFLERKSKPDHSFPAPKGAPGASKTRKPNELSGVPETALIIHSRGRALYGPDTRVDWYDIKDESIKRLAQATVALFDEDQIAVGTPAKLKSWQTLQQAHGLCTGEKFIAQPAAAFCSGTLVAPDLVLTAGHCVRTISPYDVPPLTSTKFVFGYRIETAGADVASIPADNIFTGMDFVNGEYTASEGDWALVRLDRPVPQSLAVPLSAWGATSPAVHQGVFMIGYPDGLPLKYAPGAEVRNAAPKEYFVANLNSFHGNSGSGVFDTATKQLVGVLVRGEPDYVADDNQTCNRANSCPQFCGPSGCKLDCAGEHVTRIALVSRP